MIGVEITNMREIWRYYFSTEKREIGRFYMNLLFNGRTHVKLSILQTAMLEFVVMALVTKWNKTLLSCGFCYYDLVFEHISNKMAIELPKPENLRLHKSVWTCKNTKLSFLLFKNPPSY